MRSSDATAAPPQLKRPRLTTASKPHQLRWNLRRWSSAASYACGLAWCHMPAAHRPASHASRQSSGWCSERPTVLWRGRQPGAPGWCRSRRSSPPQHVQDCQSRGRAPARCRACPAALAGAPRSRPCAQLGKPPAWGIKQLAWRHAGLGQTRHRLQQWKGVKPLHRWRSRAGSGALAATRGRACTRAGTAAAHQTAQAGSACACQQSGLPREVSAAWALQNISTSNMHRHQTKQVST